MAWVLRSLAPAKALKAPPGAHDSNGQCRRGARPRQYARAGGASRSASAIGRNSHSSPVLERFLAARKKLNRQNAKRRPKRMVRCAVVTVLIVLVIIMKFDGVLAVAFG